MNNFSMKLKKAFSNKNFVTALCFVLIGIVLVFGYSYAVNKATTPVKVPYALVTITPQTKITSDMIGYKSIASEAVDDEIIYRSQKEIVGKYVNLESTVYAGSMFYRGAVVEKDELATSALLDIPDGQTLLSLDVTMKSSYYNSLVPGDYFDLYVRTIGVLPNDKNKSEEIIVGKLIDKIKILAVKTEDGQNATAQGEARVPAGVLFAVPEDQSLLIRKADYFTELRDQDIAEIQFVIVPRGTKYKSEDGNEVISTITSEQLEEYINEHTKDIDVNQINSNTNGSVNKER